MKRTLTLLLALVLLISTLTGCGSKQKTDTADEPTSKDSVAVSDDNSVPVVDLDYAETEDEADEEVVTGHTHNYTANVTKEATCLENGEKKFTCECGDTYNETVPATNHAYDKSEKTNESKSNGKTVVTTVTTYTCKNCKDTYSNTKTETVIPGHTHSYTSAVTSQPTCTKAGVKTYSCSCGGSYTETIAAKGHSYTTKVVAPKEFEQGYTLHTCSNCGNSYKDNFTAQTHKHSYTSSVTKESTCTATGVKTYKCKCGNSYTENIAAKGHDWKSKTIHHDAVYGTRNITETWTRTTVYIHFYLNQKGIDAGLDNQAEMRKDPIYYSKFGDKEYKPTHTVKVCDGYFKLDANKNIVDTEWIYRYDNSLTNITQLCDKVNKDFAFNHKNCASSYGTTSIENKEERVVGTERYVITAAYDETVTTCSRCGITK